jgi:endonuclease/exonuclease/phosphatase family metal-dependent hydrolase
MTGIPLSRHLAAVSAAVILLGGLAGCAPVKNYLDPLGPVFFGVSSRSPQFEGKELLVVSYNIELGKRIDQAISELDGDTSLGSADIYLLQEMDPTGVEKIAEHFDLNYIYYPSAVHSKHGKDYGNAILSRWPLKDYLKIVLPHRDPLRKQIRIGAAATAVIGDREIRIISAHTEMYRLWTGARLEQIDSLTRAIDTCFAYVIVGGDFNTVRSSVLRRFDKVFESVGMGRATEGIGSTSRSDPIGIIPFELDHIYTRGFLVTGRGKAAKTRASDHHPVWVTLRFARGS